MKVSSELRVKVIVIGLVIATAVAAFYYQKYRIPPANPFAKLQLTDLNGKPVDLAEFKEKKVLFSFFATWCGPCVYEIPLLEQVWTELAGENYVFVLISDESLPKLNRFSEHSRTAIRILHSKQPLKTLGIHTVPTNYLINSKGEMVMKRVGNLHGSYSEIAREFNELCR